MTTEVRKCTTDGVPENNKGAFVAGPRCNGTHRCISARIKDKRTKGNNASSFALVLRYRWLHLSLSLFSLSLYYLSFSSGSLISSSLSLSLSLSLSSLWFYRAPKKVCGFRRLKTMHKGPQESAQRKPSRNKRCALSWGLWVDAWAF